MKEKLLGGDGLTLREELAAANKKIVQYEQERYLLDRGCPVGDVDYYHMKVSGMITDAKSFEAAADEFVGSVGFKDCRERADSTVRISTGAGFGGCPLRKPLAMNDLLRQAIRG